VLKNDSLSNILGGIGGAIDVVELLGIYSVLPAQIPARFDVIVGLAGSFTAGESYPFQQPHDDLPNATILGQDFWVAAIDASVAEVAYILFPIAGALAGAVGSENPIGVLPGAKAGLDIAKSVDTTLTAFGLYNDISRTPLNTELELLPPVPTYGGAGILWEEKLPRPVILIYEQCPPNDCS
jgi:hypothetical protein